jgi:hypothetical protein
MHLSIDNNPVFVDFRGRLRQLLGSAGEPQWPLFLAAAKLDDLLLGLICRARYG